MLVVAGVTTGTVVAGFGGRLSMFAGAGAKDRGDAELPLRGPCRVARRATLGFGGLVGDIDGLGQGDSVATIDATGDWRNASKKARTAFFEPSNSTRPLRWASASEEWPR